MYNPLLVITQYYFLKWRASWHLHSKWRKWAWLAQSPHSSLWESHVKREGSKTPPVLTTRNSLPVSRTWSGYHLLQFDKKQKLILKALAGEQKGCRCFFPPCFVFKCNCLFAFFESTQSVLWFGISNSLLLLHGFEDHFQERKVTSRHRLSLTAASICRHLKR